MTEQLLQFIWQYRYFNVAELRTEQGEPVIVERAGLFNRNQGPDFLEGAVRIGGVLLVGNIELHIRSSDWNRHGHSADTNYRNIILHVVWEHDTEIRSGGLLLPVLVLQPRVAKLLLHRYYHVMQLPGTIPCRSFLPALAPVEWTGWKERLLAERLEAKAAHILGRSGSGGLHWEEIAWHQLAGGFGMRVNAFFLEEVARSIPLNVLARHRQSIQQLEALLLGQANLLQGRISGVYAHQLRKEHAFLKAKYSLATVAGKPHFLRMRPAGFPTIRLAQLAMLAYRHAHFFSSLREIKELRDMRNWLEVEAGEYWNHHYRLGEESSYQVKGLGSAMADTILINAVVPVLFAYGWHQQDAAVKEKAIAWLLELPAENNSVTRCWEREGIRSASAMDSQALIQLANHYCGEKHCLRCAVGNKILGTVR